MRERLLLLSNSMMSALQRIVLVAAILAIVTAIPAEKPLSQPFTCYSDDQCRDFIGFVSCMV